MLVRFTKGPLSARSDTLTCTRPDGTVSETEMLRQGILPHEAFHFVVETVLGPLEAFFGRIAAGETLAEVTACFHATEKKFSLHDTPGRQIEALIDCLQADQWGGASDPKAFTKALAQASRKRHVSPLKIESERLTAIRIALRGFGAEWRPLAAGKSLDRQWLE
jgi:hypothetical protein